MDRDWGVIGRSVEVRGTFICCLMFCHHELILILLLVRRPKRALVPVGEIIVIDHYTLAVKIISDPGEVSFKLFGDTETEGLNQIFGSV